MDSSPLGTRVSEGTGDPVTKVVTSESSSPFSILSA